MDSSDGDTSEGWDEVDESDAERGAYRAVEPAFGTGTRTGAAAVIAGIVPTSRAGTRKTRRWTPEEDEALRRAVERFGDDDWKSVATLVPDRKPTQCLQRWKKTLRPGLVKGQWSQEEDELLLRLMKEVRGEDGPDWNAIALQIRGRNPKQCKERFTMVLDPNLRRGPWTEEEDRALVRLYHEHKGSWSAIARHIPGRTEHMVKTRFQRLEKEAAKSKGWTLQDDVMMVRNYFETGREASFAFTARSIPGRTKQQVHQRFMALCEVNRLLADAVESGGMPSFPGYLNQLPDLLVRPAAAAAGSGDGAAAPSSAQSRKRQLAPAPVASVPAVAVVRASASTLMSSSASSSSASAAAAAATARGSSAKSAAARAATAMATMERGGAAPGRSGKKGGMSLQDVLAGVSLSGARSQQPPPPPPPPNPSSASMLASSFGFGFPVAPPAPRPDANPWPGMVPLHPPLSSTALYAGGGNNNSSGVLDPLAPWGEWNEAEWIGRSSAVSATPTTTAPPATATMMGMPMAATMTYASFGGYPVPPPTSSASSLANFGSYMSPGVATSGTLGTPPQPPQNPPPLSQSGQLGRSSSLGKVTFLAAFNGSGSPTPPASSSSPSLGPPPVPSRLAGQQQTFPDAAHTLQEELSDRFANMGSDVFFRGSSKSLSGALEDDAGVVQVSSSVLASASASASASGSGGSTSGSSRSASGRAPPNRQQSLDIAALEAALVAEAGGGGGSSSAPLVGASVGAGPAAPSPPHKRLLAFRSQRSGSLSALLGALEGSSRSIGSMNGGL